MMREPIILCWSGGKDSVLALDRLCADSQYEVVALLTTVTQQHRVQMHGVPAELIEAQGQALGISTVFCEMPEFPSNVLYEQIFAEAVQQVGVNTVAFGDLFLEDIRQFREALARRLNITPVFPIWGADTASLAREFLIGGYRAVTCCVDGRVLPATWAGREYNAAFLRDLPARVDPCGENGEFHTFVFDGPEFAAAIPFARGAIVERNPFWYCALEPAESTSAAPNQPGCCAPLDRANDNRNICHA